MTYEEMIAKLRNEICEVTFTKVNGDERTMICTLKADFLPVKENLVPSLKDPVDLVTVYDLEEDSWRAFKPSRVVEFVSSQE